MKRVQLIPLFILLWCGGISLSSGLYYYDVNIAAFLYPIVLISIAYYALYRVLRKYAHRELISLVGTLGLSVFSMFLFRNSIIPSFRLMWNDVSYKVWVCYGIDMRMWEGSTKGSEALAISQLVAFAVAVSLYLYETHRPAAVTALPSFLLFTVSLFADGVPYEACVIAYGGALTVFLGMGRWGRSIRKFILLTGCTLLTAVLVGRFFSWPDVSQGMWEYRDQITEVSHIRSAGKEKDRTSESEKQMIDFGQFNEKGDIVYNGTIELYLRCRESFTEEKLFLRGFIGCSFVENIWSGIQMEDETDSHGNRFEPLGAVEIQNAFDTGVFVPYAVEPGVYDELLQSGIPSSYRDMSEEYLSVDKSLEQKILSGVLKKKSYDTIGDAIEIVKKYFSSEFLYTLHPGELQDGIDEVEWFMFTSKKGYCTHFSSAAVMIFRCMGIPARLAQGYMVGGDRIGTDVDVSVYDYNAHAWTEIYVDGEGWVPLDVTSYVVGGIAGTAVGRQLGDRGQQAAGRSLQKPSDGSDETDRDKREKREKRSKRGKQGANQNVGNLSGLFRTSERVAAGGIWVLLLLVAAIVLVVVFRRWRRYRALRSGMDTGTCAERLLFVNQALGRFWRVLQVPWDYMDSAKLEEDIYRASMAYSDKLLETSEQRVITRERVSRYVRCVYMSRFGKDGITEDEYGECIGFLSELLHNMKMAAEKKRWKKFFRCNMVKIILENGGKANE